MLLSALTNEAMPVLCYKEPNTFYMLKGNSSQYGKSHRSLLSWALLYLSLSSCFTNSVAV